MSEMLNLMDPVSVTFVLLGLGVLGLAALLRCFKCYPVSFPIVALALGWVVAVLPLGLPAMRPWEHTSEVLHLTEIGVILSLMGVGLKLDRIPSFKSWSGTWRLLLVCMPLTILGVALLGFWMVGLPLSAAILLGAAMAPTDPVLAEDVQVGGPGQPDSDDEETDRNEDEARSEKEDEVRFTLTSEAGLNDSMAFPFTYLALLMLTKGVAPSNWLSEWVMVDILYRIVIGVLIGGGQGWVLSKILLKLPVDTEARRMKVGVGALAATLLLYGVTECVGGYGFLAVFVGGLTIRHVECSSRSHRSLHVFAEQSEQLLMTGILIGLGVALANGVLDALTWEGALLGVLLIFGVRPLAGILSMLGEGRLSWLDRGIVSFFGIRGIGCVFYLVYGLEHGDFASQDLLWATCVFAVMLSVVIHGVSAGSVMRYRDRRIKRRVE